MIFLILSTFAFAQDVEGTWLQGCRGNFSRAEVFQKDVATLYERSYGTANCTNPQMTFTSSGRFVLGDALPIPADAKTIDFTFASVSVTVHADALVQKYNAYNVCGFSNWALNQVKDVSGLRCDFWLLHQPVPVPRVGDLRFGIYRVDGENLFFGRNTRENSGLTRETRPTEWDPRFYHRVR